MKRFFSSALSIFLVLSLLSCEVFKTTPRSSPDYRGPGSAKRNTTTNKKTATGRKTLLSSSRSSGKATSGNRTANNRTAGNRAADNRGSTESARTAASGTASSGRAAAAPVKKELAPRPAGTYTANIPEVVQIARTYTGTPYRSGGNDKQGIDCSGLICQVYTEMGVKVPRISWQQSEFGREVEHIKDIQPGDWIFFVPEGGRDGYVSHSGIVTEVRGEQDIVFIHASSSRGVVEDNLFSNYFRNRFVKAVRPF